MRFPSDLVVFVRFSPGFKFQRSIRIANGFFLIRRRYQIIVFINVKRIVIYISELHLEKQKISALRIFASVADSGVAEIFIRFGLNPSNFCDATR